MTCRNDLGFSMLQISLSSNAWKAVESCRAPVKCFCQSPETSPTVVLPKDSSELLTKLMDAADFNSNQQGQAMIAIPFFGFTLKCFHPNDCSWCMTRLMTSILTILFFDFQLISAIFCIRFHFRLLQLRVCVRKQTGKPLPSLAMKLLSMLCHRATNFCRVFQWSCSDEDVDQLLSISIFTGVFVHSVSTCFDQLVVILVALKIF